SAASRCPAGTERSPDSTSSIKNAEVKTPNPQAEHKNSGVNHQTSPGKMDQQWSAFTASRSPCGNPFQAAKYQNSSCTSNGVLRNSDTQQLTINVPKRPPESRKSIKNKASRLASIIPASVTHRVVRNPERIQCRGCPASTPCQSRAGITVAPDAADPALFAGNASHGDATVD